MSEESTTPGPVELTRHAIGAFSRRDVDALMSFCAPDAVWEARMGTFKGPAAIRGFFEEWLGAFEEHEIELEEVLDLGNGVVVAVAHASGRPAGVSDRVQYRAAWVFAWVGGMIERVTPSYTDIDEARAAAERLAEERG